MHNTSQFLRKSHYPFEPPTAGSSLICLYSRHDKRFAVGDGKIQLSYLRRCRTRSEPGGTRWRTGGEVKGKLADGVGSQYSHATSEGGVSNITQADVHTSAASSRLSWRPHRFKCNRPFRGNTKSGFCACAVTFRTSYTIASSPAVVGTEMKYQRRVWGKTVVRINTSLGDEDVLG